MLRPLFSPRLGGALGNFFPDRVTLEAPGPGPDWDTPILHVAARLEDALVSVVDPRSGGLLQVQQTTLFVLEGTPVRANWVVTNEATGQRYVAGAPALEGLGPQVEVPLKAAH